MVALCTLGGTVTLVTTGWSLGQFMGDSQRWNKQQDERFARHLETTRVQTKRLTDAVESMSAKVSDNGSYGAAFKARQESIESRLARLESEI